MLSYYENVEQLIGFGRIFHRFSKPKICFLILLKMRRININEISDLIHLDLEFNYKTSDVSPLKGLTNLVFLNLELNRISDVSPLESLTNLVNLDFDDNQVQDVSPLKNMTNLIELDLDTNAISDISALENMTNLIELDLHGNQISDISALKNMTNLANLDLDDNEISDISPLKNMMNLRTLLDLDGNKISDISALSVMLNLTELDLHDNEISGIFPLKNLVNLSQVESISIRLLQVTSQLPVKCLSANNARDVERTISFGSFVCCGCLGLLIEVLVRWTVGPAITGLHPGLELWRD